MTKNDLDNILEKNNQVNLSDLRVSLFMNANVVSLKSNYTLKSTIETFRVHHITGAPVVDSQNLVIGVISEYDLLIQAASKPLSSVIEFQKTVIGAFPETTLKEILVILYKQKLKWLPVMDKEGYLKGVISRIDVLHFISKNS